MTPIESSNELRIAIAGLGAIGTAIATKLAEGIPGMGLTAVSQRDNGTAPAFLLSCTRPPAVVEISQLASFADIVIECAPSHLLPYIAEPVMNAKKKLIVLSAGALLAHPHLLVLAKQGGQILVPSGALGGLDAVASMAEGTIYSAKLVTRKPIAGLRDAPYLTKHGIEITNLDAPLLVFSGTAGDAAQAFPANMNVAAALALAGIGPERTHVELWADPAAIGNTHRIEIESDSGRMSMEIEGLPSPNPKTARIAALSVLAMLRKMQAPLRVGS